MERAASFLKMRNRTPIYTFHHRLREASALSVEEAARACNTPARKRGLRYGYLDEMRRSIPDHESRYAFVVVAP